MLFLITAEVVIGVEVVKAEVVVLNLSVHRVVDDGYAVGVLVISDPVVLQEDVDIDLDALNVVGDFVVLVTGGVSVVFVG